MAGKITQRKKRELHGMGLSSNTIDYMDYVVKEAPRKIDPDPPLNKDSLMFQPVSAWDKIDRKGKWGDRLVSTPSRLFRERYDMIDWRK